MVPVQTVEEFTLLGGPLYGLGRRLGLVRNRTNTIWLGVALGAFAWGVLVVLALLEGFGHRILSLHVTAVHVRFLVTVPLLFVCQTWVVPEIAEFVRYIVRAGIVPEAAVPTLASTIGRIGRMKDSAAVEAVLLLLAFAVPVTERIGLFPGKTGSWEQVLHSAGGNITLTNFWYLGICLPLFRFLLLRALWWMGLWWYFLWRVERLSLNLVPTHSDGAAGLGYLAVVQEHFAPFALAISALCSAELAEGISTGTMAFETLYYWSPTVVLLIAALFIGPLMIFVNKLWISRTRGMRVYMEMASRYATAFENKWIRNRGGSDDSILGTSDIQSLADLTNSIDIVRGMGYVPVNERLLVVLGASAVAPLLPLVLLKYPFAEVAARIVELVTGF